MWIPQRDANVVRRAGGFDRRWAILTVALIALVRAPPLAAQGGSIRARVADEFRRPISAAQVTIVGTAFGAVTDSTGDVFVGQVPLGAHTLRAVRPGYLPTLVTVIVSSVDTSRATLTLLRDRQGADSIGFVSVPQPIDTTRLGVHVSASAIVRSRAVRVVASAVRAGDVMPLRLFDDFSLVFSVSRVERYGASGSRITGDVHTQSGQSRGTANFVLNEGRLTGNVRIGPALFLIRPEIGGVHSIIEADPSRLPRETPPLGAPPEPAGLQLLSRPMRAELLFLGSRAGDAPADACSAPLDRDVGRVPEVRVLVGYSPAARDAQGSTAKIEEMIAMSVDAMQTALDESGLRVDVALAGTVVVGITESTDLGTTYWLDELLSAATTDAAVRSFRDKRESYHADAMVLVSEFAIGGATRSPLWPRGTFRDSAYTVVGRKATSENMTLAHELGHILGGRDEALEPRSALGAQSVPPERNAYAYRCRFCPSDPALDRGWVTLMGRVGADNTLPPGHREARIPRFSNPDRTWEDHVTGTPIGAVESADHRATFEFFAATVANYRTTPAWFVASSGWLPWSERSVADETRDELRLADLDGDGLADAFRTDAATGTWWWSRHTTEPWAILNGPDPSLAIALADVRFADFDGDGAQDVFWIADGKWFISHRGSSAAALLNDQVGTPSHPLTSLAFGDFTKDGKSDVFRSHPATGAWWISHDGSGAWKEYLPASTSRMIATADLRFADLDGDARTDVFASHRTSTKVIWRYVASGSAAWTELQTFSLVDGPPLVDLALGAFDGTPGADILVTTGSRWLLSVQGRGPLTEVAKSCHRLAALWVADIDGDGILDVFRTGIRP